MYTYILFVYLGASGGISVGVQIWKYIPNMQWYTNLQIVYTNVYKYVISIFGCLGWSICRCHQGVVWNMWMRHVTQVNESCHIYKSCHIYEWVVSYRWLSHVTQMTESSHTDDWVMSHIWMSHVIHMNESCHTYEWVVSYRWLSHVTHMDESSCTHLAHLAESQHANMGWLRLVSPLKLQVSFAKEPYKRDDILQKRPIILRRLRMVGTL